MIRKIKQALGIEGVKIVIDVPVEQIVQDGKVVGVLKFETKHDQLVKSVNLRLVETYTRGRRKSKRIDEYLLGELDFIEDIHVKADEIVEKEFVLNYELLPSRVDEMQDKNILFKGIGGLAKFVKNAKSQFHLEAVAKVKGTALNPIAKREVYLK